MFGTTAAFVSVAATALLVVVAVSRAGCTEDPEHEAEWWKDTVIYQVYPRSFQDSDGDGIGDLRGIRSRLDYFQYLHVDTVWLSPICKSPMKDFGYDVADYRDIDPIFGSMDDFDQLLHDMHQRGMRLLMDFIPNHTSDEHAWFTESKKGGQDNPYADYYRWTDGKLLEDGSRAPPNNWLSFFGGSAWQWQEDREQYYLHQYLPAQPDLNYTNPLVRSEIMDALMFWVDKGVDGFRVDALTTLFEVQDLFEDEPSKLPPGQKPQYHEDLQHTCTQNRPEVHHVVSEWRQLLDQYETRTGKHVFLLVEVYDEGLKETMKYYHSGGDMPFNFNLLFVDAACGGTCVRRLVDDWLDKMPTDKWPNFQTGNHDQKRISSRKGAVYKDVLNMLLLTLPGTPITYYGEELGLMDIHVAYEDTQDPFGISVGPELCESASRDPCRAPMQWSDEKNAGFSTADTTWLPAHPDYVTRNVQNQMSEKGSHLQIYRQLTDLRRHNPFRSRHMTYSVVNDNVVSYLRSEDGFPVYLIALNVGSRVSTDDYTVLTGGREYASATVLITSAHISQDFLPGSTVDLHRIKLSPGDGLVLELLSEQSPKDEL